MNEESSLMKSVKEAVEFMNGDSSKARVSKLVEDEEGYITRVEVPAEEFYKKMKAKKEKVAQ